MRPISRLCLISVLAAIPYTAFAATDQKSKVVGSPMPSVQPSAPSDKQPTKGAAKSPNGMPLIEIQGYKVTVPPKCIGAVYDNNLDVLSHQCDVSSRFAAALFYIGEQNIDIGDKGPMTAPLASIVRAAEEGYVPAIYYAGIIYYAIKDYNAAYPYLEEAAKHGMKDAMPLVGIINLLDDLKEPDPVRGLAWLIIASLNGNELALKYMKLLDEHTSPEMTQAAFEQAKVIMQDIKYHEMMSSTKGCIKT